MRFGVALPAFAALGVADFRTPAVAGVDWPLIRDVARDAEDWGLDSVWVSDHLYLGVDDVHYECQSVLAALAVSTSRVRLGTIHFGTGFRHPSMVAKSLATIDQISGGRLECMLDPGWREREFRAFGLPWIEDPDRRLAAFREAVEIVLDVWQDVRPNRTGEFYDVHGAPASPPPAQRPHPPLWLGEAVSEAHLDLVVQHADVWNSVPCSPLVLAEKLERLEAACARNGRPAKDIRRTLETQVLLRESSAEIDAWFTENDQRFEEARHLHESRMDDVVAFMRSLDPGISWPPTRETVKDAGLIGTPDEVVAKLREYALLGIDEVICWPIDLPDRRSMRLLADVVMPQMLQLPREAD